MNKQLKLALISLAISNIGYAQEQNESCNPIKKGEQDSTCFGAFFASVGNTTTQSITKNIAPPPIRPFAGGLTCVTPWGSTVANGNGVNAFMAPKGVYNPTSKQWAVDCVEQYRVCVNGSLSGSYQYQSCELDPVQGSCGSAHGQYFTDPTAGPQAGSGLCNPEFVYGGQPTDDSPPSTPAYSAVVLNNNTYSWTCAGEAGGSTASCVAYERINAECGGSVNDCAKGNLTGQTQTDIFDGASKYVTTTYNWQCNGINTGSNASCSTDIYDPSKATPTPSKLGTSNGQSFLAGWSNYAFGFASDNWIVTGIMGNACSSGAVSNTASNILKNPKNNNSVKTITWNCGAEVGGATILICGQYLSLVNQRNGCTE